MSAAYVAKETIGDCTLYLGDMRAVLPELDEGADLCVTDAPYKLTSGGRASVPMRGKFHPDRYDNKGSLMKTLPWQAMSAPIFDALADRANAYVMANGKNVFPAHSAFVSAGFKFHEQLSWDKGRITRQPFYARRQEFTLFFWKGRARHVTHGGVSTLFACPPPDLDWHPTSKPTSLMALYVLQSSSEGQLVLDPFAGSAATLLAALAFGRRAIGIELDPVFFDRSCERLYAAQADGFAQVRGEWERDRLANRIRGLEYAA